MNKKTCRYKDCVVTREEVCSVGADWKERLAKGLPAGEKRQMVSVTREHENFTEVLLPSDPLFQEAKNATWGGRRPGAGRPKTGAMPNKTIRMTDEEYIKVKEYLKELRASQK